MTNNFRPLLSAFGLATIAFIAHASTVYFLEVQNSLPLLSVLYSVLFVSAIVILIILIQVMKRNIDNVGYAFMLLTCIKMVIVYLVFKTFAVETGTEGMPKVHLITAFFVMLGIETFCTIRMLNKN